MTDTYRVRVLWLVVAAALALPFQAQAQIQTQTPSEALAQVIDDQWAHTMEQFPRFATSLGIRDYDDRLESQSIAFMDAGTAKDEEFLVRLDAIDREALTPDERLNYDLLKGQLAQSVESNGYNGRLMLITNRNGWHSSFANFPDRAPFFTLADYESYVARLNDYSRFNQEGIETLRASIEAGYTQPCAPMTGYEDTISAHIVENLDDSVFLTPFADMPETISNRDQKRLRKSARDAVKDSVIPAYEAFLDFYRTEYAPACRDEAGISAVPGGDDYYAYLVRYHTTTDKTPDEIHDIGLSEVKRIRGEMQTVMDEVDFDGDLAAFFEFLRTDPQFYAKSEDELMAVAATISKRMDGELPNLFSRYPRMPYTVKPIPADIAEKSTTAYYQGPAGDGSRAGVYFVNTSKLDSRPLFEMEALSLHEAVPGHHFQIALAQELEGVPPFRRFGRYTAYIEGWGLYSERLGLEVGFYEDPYANFGRLSYEMWRACRLVVDTGLHAKGWTRQQAIDFMAENTALALHNIEAEVDRYITWPGQALAYKIGELKILELRARAEKELGADFDKRRFHDTLLANGAVPLSVLEDMIDEWIAGERQG